MSLLFCCTPLLSDSQWPRRSNYCYNIIILPLPPFDCLGWTILQSQSHKTQGNKNVFIWHWNTFMFKVGRNTQELSLLESILAPLPPGLAMGGLEAKPCIDASMVGCSSSWLVSGLVATIFFNSARHYRAFSTTVNTKKSSICCNHHKTAEPSSK